MTDSVKIITLAPDTTASDMAGEPKPLEPVGNVKITAKPGNPDETVKLTDDMEDSDGVEISKDITV
jgi:hypothetical protein